MQCKRLFILLSAFVLLGSCSKVCDTDGLPQYQLTAGELSWRTPYVVNTEWRFRNAANYERVYRITKSETKMEGSGGGKSSLCPNFYRQEIEALVERSDSANSRTSQRFSMQAKINDNSTPFNGNLTWGSVSFQAPIDKVSSGATNNGPEWELLPQLTVGSKTYTQVLKSTAGGGSAPVPRPTDPYVVYTTSAAGVIRVVDRNGTVWDRQ